MSDIKGLKARHTTKCPAGPTSPSCSLNHNPGFGERVEKSDRGGSLQCHGVSMYFLATRDTLSVAWDHLELSLHLLFYSI